MKAITQGLGRGDFKIKMKGKTDIPSRDVLIKNHMEKESTLGEVKGIPRVSNPFDPKSQKHLFR